MSSSAPAPVTYAADADGVGWITFDDPEARANVFTPRVQASLAAALDAAERNRPKALVVVSAKDRIFIAGADLKWLAALPNAEAAAKVSREGQRLFQRIADSAVPVVCAIHGACAGGGFELALACHWRIASEADVTRIGLPETGIGTIPGWGGSVRLPRLVGVKAALEHILRAQLVSARAALEAGLVNELVDVNELRARAKAAALKLAAEGFAVQAPRAAVPEGVFSEMRSEAERRGGKNNPALLAAVEAVERTAELKVEEALEVEAEVFGRVTAGVACKNLVRVFFLKEAARKRGVEGWFEGEGRDAATRGRVDTERQRKVGVVGAGVMGAGIAQWAAAQGCEVVLRDVDSAAVERGIAAVRRLFDEAVRRGKMVAGEANSGLRRVRVTTGWEGFAECDVVIEAIVEDAPAKRALFSEVARVAREDAVLASNTSALPIEEIAGHVPRPERTIGIHFFNPVSRMPLVELVLAQETSRDTAERALELVRVLGKSPVVCRSSPGFLVTRVLFFYLNAAVRRWESGVRTEEIDGAMRDWGWPMGPMRLIDEVGVDVADFIFGEMAQYFPGRFEKTATCGRMVAAGLRGRKGGTGRGFYRYEGGMERVNEEAERWREGRRSETAPLPDGVEEALMTVMVEEARQCLAEGVVKAEDEVDFALLSGAGFPAWRGGLMRWAGLREKGS